jgi:hypothetical protein
VNVINNAVRWLGQGDATDLAAWTTYLQALRANLIASWSRAVSAYNGLKKTREQLGLPFMVTAGAPESAAPGMSSDAAWAPDLEQNAADLMSMVQVIVSAIDDVLANKRQLEWDDTAKQFFIQGLPEDVLRIEVKNGVPVLVDKTGKEVHPVPEKGVGTVGIPAIVWFATATFSVLALPAYFVVEKAVDSMTNVAEQKTMRTIADKSYECVQSGKCTPEEAAKINSSIYSGASGVHEAKAKEEAEKSKSTTDITKTITTLALVGLGIAVIYAIVRFIPAPAPRTTALARNSLDEAA